MSTIIVNCVRCKNPFTARVADRKRGWARFCSKSCKAIVQTQRTGRRGPSQDRDEDFGDEVGWDAHKLVI